MLPLSKWFNQLLQKNSERVKLASAYRDVFSTVSGRMVLEHIALLGGLDKPSHTPGDPHHTAFLDGQKRLALEIMTRARAEVYDVLMDEEYYTDED